MQEKKIKFFKEHFVWDAEVETEYDALFAIASNPENVETALRYCGSEEDVEACLKAYKAIKNKHDINSEHPKNKPTTEDTIRDYVKKVEAI